jgi:hypothetical protein
VETTEYTHCPTMKCFSVANIEPTHVFCELPNSGRYLSLLVTNIRVPMVTHLNLQHAIQWIHEGVQSWSKSCENYVQISHINYFRLLWEFCYHASKLETLRWNRWAVFVQAEFAPDAVLSCLWRFN